MKTRIASALLAALLAVPVFAGIFRAAPANGVPDVYIVVLNGGVSSHPRAPRADLPSVAQAAAALGRVHGGKVEEVWEHALQGFVIRMPEARAKKLAEDPRVKSVEQNLFISGPVGDCYYGTAWQDTRTLPSATSSPQSLTCSDPDPLNDTGSGAPACKDNWGLDRIDQTSWSRNGQYGFPNGGSNVHVYVLDTGIRWSHREFLNSSGVTRVSGGVDARTNPVTAGTSTNTDDCYGHGTHVAGIIAGRTFGVAKNALLHPVRTIGCPTDPLSNTQFINNTIRGLNWIVSEVTTNRGFMSWPAVVNWSGGNHTLYTGNSGLQTAVAGVVDSDIVLVQAAGNQSPDWNASVPTNLHDACDWSFGGSVPKVIVAGGMDFNDGRWTRRPSLDTDDARYCGSDCGSNAGSCVDVWSPSAHIIASNRGANDLACRLSGTSMAAPHVAGAAAIYLSANTSASVSDVDRALRSRATWGSLQSSSSNANYIGGASDNAILYSQTTSIGDTAPVASFTISCPGRQCNFSASASTDDGSISSYAWQFGDGTTGSGSSVQHVYAANFTGQVVLKVTDNTGKTDHLRKDVSVNADAPPTASFTYSCSAGNCSFNSTGSIDDVSIASRSWNFGDSTTGSGTSPSHTYSSSATYAVVLTVTDNVGQTGTQTQNVAVTTSVPTPTNVAANASGGTVTITWTPVSGADSYEVQRKVSSAAWAVAQTVSGGSSSSTSDTPSAPNGVVLYRVLAKAGTTYSTPSSNDVAYAASFTDAALNVPTAVRAEHVTELRRGVNTLRDIAGLLPVYSTSEVDANVLRAQAVDDAHFTTLLTNLNAARSAVGLSGIGLGTNPAAPNGVFATQINDLRNGLR